MISRFHRWCCIRFLRAMPDPLPIGSQFDHIIPITVLDTHDGIGVIEVGTNGKGEPGLLTPDEIDKLVETIHSRSKDQSRQATGAAANNLDLYQVNCTFFNALGRRGSDYLIARAIQFFAPGIPQIYYVGLLAGTNDMELLARTQVGRDINRHYYTSSELQSAFTDPVVRQLLNLIRLRNTHPAFAGRAQVEAPSHQTLGITWNSDGHWAKLDVDFATPRALITYSTINAAQEQVVMTWSHHPGLSVLRKDDEECCGESKKSGRHQVAHVFHVHDVRDDDRFRGRHHS